MVCSVHRPSDGEIAAMRRLATGGFTTRRIARVFDVSSGTVSYWLRRSRNRCENYRRPPRRNVAVVDKRRRLVRNLVVMQTANGQPQNPSAMSIKRVLARDHSISVSKTTVIRDLRALAFSAVVRPKVCCTRVDHATRLEFAKRWLRTNASRIVFSDEKIFTTNDEGCRTQWIGDGQRPLPRVQMRWPPGRVMVWGVIGTNFRHLVVFPNTKNDNEHFTLTARGYVKRCLAAIVPFLQRTGRRFQQDGAACHTARSTAAYLEGKGVAVLLTPPRSPDLNVIETLWAVMAKKVTELAPTNRQELVEAIEEVWAALNQDTIDALIRSFNRRCQNVITNGGGM